MEADRRWDLSAPKENGGGMVRANGGFRGQEEGIGITSKGGAKLKRILGIHGAFLKIAHRIHSELEEGRPKAQP